MTRRCRALAVLALPACLSMPGPAPREQDGGGERDAGGTDAAAPTCPVGVDIDSDQDLAGFALNVTAGCEIDTGEGAVTFENNGATCMAFLETPDVVDLAGSTAEVTLVDSSEDLPATFAAVFPGSSRSIYFTQVDVLLALGECLAPDDCDTGVHGTFGAEIPPVRWRFALEGTALRLDVAAVGSAWSPRATVPLSEADGTTVLVQVGAMQSTSPDEEDIAFDDLRICDRAP